MPRGGFDLGGAFRDVGSILNVVDDIKQRRLRRENPLAAALQGLMQAEGFLGETELEERPQLMEQVARLHGVETPEGMTQVREQFTGTKSRAKQARIRDFQSNMANVMDQIQQTRQRNQQMISILEGTKADPDLVRILKEQQFVGEQQMIQGMMNSLKTGFRDVLTDPEVVQMLQGSSQQGIMGPTTPVRPGGAPTPQPMPRRRPVMQSGPGM